MPDLKNLHVGGAMGGLIRARDWSADRLGPIDDWPQSLRSALGICLRSAAPAAVFWGPDHLYFYNDGWLPFLGERHPDALGEPAASAMAEFWPAVAADFDEAFSRGETVNRVDAVLLRGGQETFWTYSLVPIGDEEGRIGGLFAQARETTQGVMRGRRERLLLRLAEKLRRIEDPDELLDAALHEIAAEIGAGRVGYGELDEQEQLFVILRCRTQGGMKDIRGRYPLGHFSTMGHQALRRGEPVSVEDGESWTLLDPEGAERWKAIGCRASLVVPLVSGGRYTAALFAHEEQPRRWTGHDAELLAAALERLSQELARARAQRALRHSEERYRRIFEQANDIILTADLDQVLTDCNPAAALAMGMTREELIGRRIAEFVSAEGFEQTSRMLRHKLEHGGTTRHEIDVHSPSGAVLHWEINSTLATDDAGEIVGLHAIARDVTERRRAEERQKLLVNELNHRVKNTLALVQGLALQTFRGGDPQAAEARRLFEDRLQALARAHDLLTRESWEGATLAELLACALGPHAGEGGRIAWSGPPATLGPKAAVSLAMAVHELATNAAKYGALSVPQGRVEIEWGVAERKLDLVWRERGGPPASPPARRGFGLRMIERALAADLAGAAAIEFAREGLTCRIEAALEAQP